MIEFKKGYYRADDMDGVCYIGETLNSDNTLVTPEEFLKGIQKNVSQILITQLKENDEMVFMQLLRDYGVEDLEEQALALA